MSGGLEPGNHGKLTAVVWPPYVGLWTALGEPLDDPNYSRGMIRWRTEKDGTILGSARITVPTGAFTHLVFFSGPGLPHPSMGVPQKLEHPVVFDRPGFIDIDPIQNQDYLPRWPA